MPRSLLLLLKVSLVPFAWLDNCLNFAGNYQLLTVVASASGAVDVLKSMAGLRGMPSQ